MPAPSPALALALSAAHRDLFDCGALPDEKYDPSSSTFREVARGVDKLVTFLDYDILVGLSARQLEQVLLFSCTEMGAEFWATPATFDPLAAA